ncbi:glutathione S-transferase family protein [uncultured Roseibium sp.]|uniref:glutathione S-transferase family protein n=1 Tax=uncultured Roseibium sp. TaxID=1936171 RepID=UPI0032179E0E
MVRLFGADYSVYVRICRLVLEEKQVGYELMPVDVFAENGPPNWYAEKHPFGKIPTLEHGDLALFETGAITRYVDEAFEGPALQPDGPVSRARMNQILSILDNYAYPSLVWGLYVEQVSKPTRGGLTDETRVAEALPLALTCLKTLEALKHPGPWLLGDRLTLADLYAAPMFACFIQAPASAALMADCPSITDWWLRIRERDSLRKT